MDGSYSDEDSDDNGIANAAPVHRTSSTLTFDDTDDGDVNEQNHGKEHDLAHARGESKGAHEDNKEHREDCHLDHSDAGPANSSQDVSIEHPVDDLHPTKPSLPKPTAEEEDYSDYSGGQRGGGSLATAQTTMDECHEGGRDAPNLSMDSVTDARGPPMASPATSHMPQPTQMRQPAKIEEPSSKARPNEHVPVLQLHRMACKFQNQKDEDDDTEEDTPQVSKEPKAQDDDSLLCANGFVDATKFADFQWEDIGDDTSWRAEVWHRNHSTNTIDVSENDHPSVWQWRQSEDSPGRYEMVLRPGCAPASMPPTTQRQVSKKSPTPPLPSPHIRAKSGKKNSVASSRKALQQPNDPTAKKTQPQPSALHAPRSKSATKRTASPQQASRHSSANASPATSHIMPLPQWQPGKRSSSWSAVRDRGKQGTPRDSQVGRPTSRSMSPLTSDQSCLSTSGRHCSLVQDSAGGIEELQSIMERLNFSSLAPHGRPQNSTPTLAQRTSFYGGGPQSNQPGHSSSSPEYPKGKQQQAQAGGQSKSEGFTLQGVTPSPFAAECNACHKKATTTRQAPQELRGQQVEGLVDALEDFRVLLFELTECLPSTSMEDALLHFTDGIGHIVRRL